MIKKDIRYIIKRVIIYVLVALILGFIGKKSVFADTNQYYLDLNTTSSTALSLSSVETSNVIANLNLNGGNLNLSCNVNDLNCYYLLFQANYEGGENTFLLYYFSADSSFITNYDTYALDYSNWQGRFDYFNGTIYSVNSDIDYSLLNNYSINPDNLSSLVSSMSNNRFNGYRLVYNSSDDNFSFSLASPSNRNFVLQDYDIVDTNIPKNFVSKKNLVLNNYYEYIPTPTDPLEDYTKIDLTGYQALLAVPKNYPYLASEYGYVNDNDEDYIHYTFGYENCINPVLINMSNLENWYSFSNWNDNSNDNYCGSTPTLMSLDYPLQNEDNYNYMGILIYNNSLLYDYNSNDWVNNQQNPYGESYAYINEEYYDYYLINDYNAFNQTLDFTDFEGQTTTLYISTLPTFTDLAGQVFSQQDINDNLSTRQKIDKLLSFGKLPFDFFKRTITAECRPLRAPFPHGNFDIELPCLSSSFESFMGSTLYGVIRLIINGLLVYRISMSLIVFTTKKLDPKDCSIEVGALL